MWVIKVFGLLMFVSVTTAASPKQPADRMSHGIKNEMRMRVEAEDIGRSMGLREAMVLGGLVGDGVGVGGVGAGGAGMMPNMTSGEARLELDAAIHLAAHVAEEWMLITDEMPSDDRLVPGVGNGHVATQVLSDTIYMNQVFNGELADTHRARIPSTVAVNISLDGAQDSAYSLDLWAGVFVRLIDHEDVIIRQHVYAHRVRTRIIVNEFQVFRKPAAFNTTITINLSNNHGNISSDIDLVNEDLGNGTVYTHGAIFTPEQINGTLVQIHQYSTHVPDQVTMPAELTVMRMRFLTSLSTHQQDAHAAYMAALGVDPEVLLDGHAAAWASLWDSGRIDVFGNSSLARHIHSAMFHILISIPDFQDELNPFGGISPGGLARGGKVNDTYVSGAYNDYAGHTFWDMDTWVMPPLLMLHPEKARLLLTARTRVHDQVRKHATETGYRGVRFPWEQGYSGEEVCPWDLATIYQIHVTADVAYAARQYLYATHDIDFLSNGGLGELILDIARFWDSRTERVSATQWGIYGVMGPDEYNYNVNNSAFTNFNANLSLSLPAYLRDHLGIVLSGADDAELDGFLAKGAAMYIPFDEVEQYHPQFDGFDKDNQRIKQSDVVLLGYPLMMKMDPSVRENDLTVYEGLTDLTGPDTGTWSMHTVGWLELGQPETAADRFYMMFRNINGDFQIWSEKPAYNPQGMRCTNFITGAGGFLQSIVFGYGGLRLAHDRLGIDPYVLPHTDGWALRGINYQGSVLDLALEDDLMTLTLTGREWNDTESLHLVLYDGGMKATEAVPLMLGSPVVRSRGKGALFVESLLPAMPTTTPAPTKGPVSGSPTWRVVSALIVTCSALNLFLKHL